MAAHGGNLAAAHRVVRPPPIAYQEAAREAALTAAAAAQDREERSADAQLRRARRPRLFAGVAAVKPEGESADLTPSPALYPNRRPLVWSVRRAAMPLGWRV